MLPSSRMPKFVAFLLVVAASLDDASAVDSKYSLETKYMKVPLDHFKWYAEEKSFNLRYLVDAKHHVQGGPIFVFTGDKGDINIYAQNTGFMFDIAPMFKALLVFIEHRYYGQSLPFGNDTFSNPQNMIYLTTTQALADFAFVIDQLKREFFENVVQYDTYPIVAFGSSYGGMLAAWLRMKYPYTVLGAISSSAPMFYFPGLSSCATFYEKVTKVFERYGRDQCIKTIKLGWDVIINLTKNKLGMDFVSSNWKLCSKISTTDDVEKLLEWLSDIYVNLALSNYHYPTDFYSPLPAYPVKVFCDKLTTSYFNDTKGLIEHFGYAIEMYTNYTGRTACNDINSKYHDITEFAFGYQMCTELIMPKCSTDADMFITAPWDFDKFAKKCYKKYGTSSSRPDWGMLIYGGKNLKYFSNIVFSNGEMDPYSCCGVSANVTSSVMAFDIIDAPHHVDLRNADMSDNNYIQSARQFHILALRKWLKLE
ncbi:unnamed protein product [Phyllotreta striolata]|uniref:Lysosomal Pro-X carboxypeptidase n=1 Tax=Phyllotreta striolata TaxID=444603 RepID=A0A9N9XWA4_PHYSR|nr:unnamed protein product [Phyllotreta striolata]